MPRRLQTLFTPAPARNPYLRRVHTLLHPPQRAHRVRLPEINSHVIAFPHLPPALSGLKIVQLSDIHYGLYLHARAAERMIEQANGLRADLIAITGDFVTTSRQFIEPISELLSHLRARLGVYAVLGNHDFRAGAESVTSALTRVGIDVLRNTSRILRVRGSAMKLVGIDDSRQRPDLAQAVGARHSRMFTLLLAHNPVVLEPAARLGIDFVLSGHTHGGQIKFSFAEALYQRFLPEGFLASADTLMYVNRGVGKVILPVRLSCPPEVASFTLRAGRTVAPQRPARKRLRRSK